MIARTAKKAGELREGSMALIIDNTDRRGFTLVEVMIVLAIMAIIFTIAYPDFRNYQSQRRLNGAARQVQSDLLAARMRAVMENKDIKVRFINTSQYTLFYDYNNNGQVDSGEAIETKDIHPDYYDVAIAPVSGYVPVFSSRGTAVSGNISMTGATGSKTVAVNTVGRISIE